MSISAIKNKYLRRTILVLAVPFAYALGVPGVALWGAWNEFYEALTELPSAIRNCWKGR